MFPTEEMEESKAGADWEKLEFCFGFIRYQMLPRTTSPIGQELRKLNIQSYGLWVLKSVGHTLKF